MSWYSHCHRPSSSLSNLVSLLQDVWVLPNCSLLNTDSKVWKSRSFSASAPWSLDLPQVIVDGQSVHANGHSLGGDHGELLAVWVVLVQFVDHLWSDGTRPNARVLEDHLGVWWVHVNGAELTPAVAEEDEQVVGVTLFQLLRNTHKSFSLGV